MTTAFSRILGGIGGFFSFIGANLYLATWDFSLYILNLVAFKRPVGKVIAQGDPGFGGIWPDYKPPLDSDSRSCCPALNALANHGQWTERFMVLMIFKQTLF